MNRERDLVQPRVCFNPGSERFTDFYRCNRLRAVLSASNGKGALVREAIEYPFPWREHSDLTVVINLIQIESGFLSAQKFQLEIHARDPHVQPRRYFSFENTGHQFQAFSPAHWNIIPFDNRGRRK